MATAQQEVAAILTEMAAIGGDLVHVLVYGWLDALHAERPSHLGQVLISVEKHLNQLQARMKEAQCAVERWEAGR